MLVFDTTSRQSFEECDSWLSEAAKYGASPNEIPITLCANKIDKGKSRAVSEEESREFAEARGLAYFETSAQSGQNVTDMFDYLFGAVVKNR
jgi:GTPase SAR1 family protein